MNWTLTLADILAVLLLGSAAWNIHQLLGGQKLKAVLRTGLRAAEVYKPGGRDHVRIPYNQLAELMQWRSDSYPQDLRRFVGKPNLRHPAGQKGTK